MKKRLQDEDWRLPSCICCCWLATTPKGSTLSLSLRFPLVNDQCLSDLSSSREETDQSRVIPLSDDVGIGWWWVCSFKRPVEGLKSRSLLALAFHRGVGEGGESGCKFRLGDDWVTWEAGESPFKAGGLESSEEILLSVFSRASRRALSFNARCTS